MRIDWLSPVPIFIAILVMGVIMPVFSFLDYTDAFSRDWPFLFVNKPETARTAIAIYIAAAVVFVLAYRRGLASVGTTSAPPRIVLPIGQFHVMAALLGLFTALVFGFLVINLGGIGEILAGSSDRTRAFAGYQGLFLALNVSIGVALMWFIHLARYPGNFANWIAFAIFTLLAILVVALQGQKSTIFIAIAAMAVIYNRRIRPIGPLPLVVGIIATFILLMAYHVYKQEYLVLGRIVSFSGGKQFWSSFTDFLNTQLFGNFMQLQTMSVLIEGTPAPLPFQYGQTYIAGALTMVPRAIFPGKPLPTAGIFTQAFWPDQWNNLGTTLPTGLFGEFYMNFGIPGVLAGSAVFGWMMGRLYARHLRMPDDDLRMLDCAIAIAALLHFFRGDFSAVMILILSITIPARLLIRRQKQSSPRAPNLRAS